MTRAALALVTVLAAAASSDAVLAIFTNDPIDPSAGTPYVILPGVPLVYPGPDQKFGTADDVIDPGIVGDVDLVVRTGGAYAGGPIPPPHPSVATAPVVTPGGAATGAGGQALVQGILSDGAPPNVAGNALTGPELDGRPLLAVAYADLDGDGFIGPTAADGDADDQIERQEVMVPAGRQTASFAAGLATASLALYVGAPASAGGLGIVVAGGATTGTTPFLYFDGPFVATLLPYMPPLDPNRIIGSNGLGGPVPSELLTDFELDFEKTFSPAPNHPVLGTPYAIPLDGSSPTVDLLRSESGAAAGVACGRPVDPATFVASPTRRLVPAVGPGSVRTLYEAVDALALASDGVGGAASVDCFPIDRLGNATDPPPGGFAVALEAGTRLRIVSPDTDGDPSRETLVFASAAAVTVVVDDAGVAAATPVVDHVVAVRAGLPVGALRVDLAAGPGGPGGGGPGVLGAGTTKLRFGQVPARGKIDVATVFDAGPAAIDPTTAPVVLTLTAGATPVYARTIAAGTMASNSMRTSFRFHDSKLVSVARISRLTLRRVRGTTSWQLRLRVREVDLRPISATMPTVTVGVAVGGATFGGDHACTANAAGTLTKCVR
jgi:hypothetical protein